MGLFWESGMMAQCYGKGLSTWNRALVRVQILEKRSLRAASFSKSDRIASYGEKDVWNIFSPLSIQHQSINLGQGFPNFPAADFVKQSVHDAVFADSNQYMPSRGFPPLLKILATSYTAILKRNIQPDTEIMVSQGANEGLYAVIQSFVNPGDEAIVIEPYFDIYKYHLELAGAKMVSVPLRPKVPFNQNILASDWRLDMHELRSKITDKTKLLILNTPHNPTGKVYSYEELEELSRLVIEKNLLVVSDEVVSPGREWDLAFP